MRKQRGPSFLISLLVFVLLGLLPSPLFAISLTDSTEADFNAGTHTNTTWNGSTTALELNSTGKTNGTGTFSSSIKDAGSSTQWNTLSWLPETAYGKELPNSKAVETGYPSTNADMSTNQMLLHLNESSGSLVDGSGQANSGTSSGGFTYSATGKFNSGVSLDGINGKISVAHNANLNITGNLTLEAWIKRNGAGRMRIISKVVSNGATNNPYDFGINTTDNLYFVRANGSALQILTDNRTISSSQWTHVAMTVGKSAFTNPQEFLIPSLANRAWQGVATDGTYFYVVTDRNAAFGLENIISKYTMNGTFVSEKTTAYNPGLADFFSFGDATVIDNKLYVAAYNFNSSPRTLPLQSRIAVFNLDDLSLIQDYNLGTGVGIAEGVDSHNGLFWVVDGNTDTYVVKSYDSSFNLVGTHPLSPTATNPVFPSGLTYQTIKWRGDDIFVNLHGSNSLGSDYAFGLDRYTWNGSSFVFIERLTPIKYGTGQGIDIIGDTFYWSDRVRNSIWSSTYVGSGNGDSIANYPVNFIINGVSRAQKFSNIQAPTGNSSATLIGARDDATGFYKGTLDEVAIYNEALTTSSLLGHYNRGVSRAKFQVRSCDDHLCSGESFIGPDNTTGTYFSELANTSLSSPSFSLATTTPNRYFQYQTTLETDDTTLTPQLNSVSLDVTSVIDPDVTVTESGENTSVTEGGATDTFTVSLATQPIASVIVAVTANSQLTASTSQLTFTTSNWSTPQTVTVHAVDDGITEGGHTGTISFGSSSTDTNYDGRTITPITVTIVDNPTAPTEEGSTPEEEGSTSTEIASSTASSTAAETSPTLPNTGFSNEESPISDDSNGESSTAPLPDPTETWADNPAFVLGLRIIIITITALLLTFLFLKQRKRQRKL